MRRYISQFCLNSTTFDNSIKSEKLKSDKKTLNDEKNKKKKQNGKKKCRMM